MESMRESWSDKRLDDLSGRVSDGFRQVDRRFDRVEADLRGLRIETRTEFTAHRGEMGDGFAALRGEIGDEFTALRGEMKQEFAALRGEMRAEFTALRGEMKSGFERMDERFERIDGRFEALHRLLLQLGGVLVAALIGLIATQL